MEMANRIEEINRLMVNQFVMKGDKVRLLVTTVSSVVKEFDQSVVDVRHASRDEFWKLCKEEMHVFLKLSTEGGFTLALLEPMMFGVPAIIAREPWSIGLFGKDYPFFVSNETQAYALVNLFHEDYPKMYAQWADWHVNVFRPLMERRFKTDLLYDLLDGNIEQFKQTRTKFAEKHPGKELNSFVADMLEAIGDASEFVLPELIEHMHKTGKVSKKMVDKLAEGDRDERGLVWSTAFNEYRVILETFHGWEDASVKVGHLRRGPQSIRFSFTTQERRGPRGLRRDHGRRPDDRPPAAEVQGRAARRVRLRPRRALQQRHQRAVPGAQGARRRRGRRGDHDAFTGIWTINPILMVGAIPVFADIDRETYNLDPRPSPSASRTRRRPSCPSRSTGCRATMKGLRAAYPPLTKIVATTLRRWARCAATSTSARTLATTSPSTASGCPRPSRPARAA